MKIDIENKIYPKQLKKLKNPPQKLYVKGNIDLLKTPGIAIIGTRKPTGYGERMTKKFTKELNLYGLTIISGMAEGIDSIAHNSSIENQGKTIAVLPSGFNNIFPQNNIELYNKILENEGLIITEYEEYEKAESQKFIERNRIVAGLSIGTLVIEGGYRSGTSVTAKIAKTLGKNVFCIPSSLENSKGITPNKLIQNGANLVTEITDIIRKYPELNLKKIEKTKQKNINISPEYKEIYEILSYEEPIHINEIIKKLKISISEANYKLMMLEIEDKIVSLPGNNYKKK